MKTIFYAAAALLIAACNSEMEQSVNTQVINEKAMAPVTVRVSDFSVTQSEFESPATTRTAENAADYDKVKGLTLAFYTSDGTEAYKQAQIKSSMGENETFGDFSLSLPMGSYTMVVLGYGIGTPGDDVFTLTSPTQAEYTSAHPRETFAYTQAVNINNTSAVDISATLKRVVARLEVKSSDTRTANATSIRISFAAGGKAFNPTTGLASDNAGYSHAVPISTAVDQTTSSISYIFLSSDEQEIDVTIETLDTDNNVLFHKIIHNVPFRRNRNTILTGGMYTNSNITGAFKLETSWISSYNVEF